MKGKVINPTVTASKGFSSTKALTRGVSGAQSKRPYDDEEVMGPMVVMRLLGEGRVASAKPGLCVVGG